MDTSPPTVPAPLRRVSVPPLAFTESPALTSTSAPGPSVLLPVPMMIFPALSLELSAVDRVILPLDVPEEEPVDTCTSPLTRPSTDAVVSSTASAPEIETTPALSPAPLAIDTEPPVWPLPATADTDPPVVAPDPAVMEISPALSVDDAPVENNRDPLLLADSAVAICTEPPAAGRMETSPPTAPSPLCRFTLPPLPSV